MIATALVLSLFGGEVASDSPALNAVDPGAPFAGESRAWLLDERNRVEAARPSQLWLIGSVPLLVLGLATVMAGFFSRELERCPIGFFGPTTCNDRPPGGVPLSLWAGGAVGLSSGIFLTSLVAFLDWRADQRLNQLGLSLSALPADGAGAPR